MDDAKAIAIGLLRLLLLLLNFGAIHGA